MLSIASVKAALSLIFVVHAAYLALSWLKGAVARRAEAKADDKAASDAFYVNAIDDLFSNDIYDADGELQGHTY